MTSEEYNLRLEVMKSMDGSVQKAMENFLIPVDDIWQPSQFLPDSRDESFHDEVRVIQSEAKELGHDFWAILVGDMITEEVLPTYSSWLMDVVGVDQRAGNAWSQWVRQWTGEENRHGDLLNKYLYLCGRVDMLQVERSVHQLLNDGFDPGTDADPYKNFVYTAFQELATYISHKRVGELAAKKGHHLLGRICKIIAGDEMRHHLAYRTFVQDIIQIDPNGIIIAFADMMKRKIVMPAALVKESKRISDTFVEFSNAAQRMGVYTSYDYVDILEKLNKHWAIDKIERLSDEAEKARNYLMALPERLIRISERLVIPNNNYQFQWVTADGML